MKKSEEIKSKKRLEKEARLREEEVARAEKFMREAISLAKEAGEMGEVPVGAVVVRGDEIIAAAHNRRETDRVATAHAELLAIEEACRRTGDWRLNDCDIFVTLEPCTMCAGAIANARIRKLYFGAADEKGGAVVSLRRVLDASGLNSVTLYEGGVLGGECAEIVRSFFIKRRADLLKQ